MDNEDVLFKLVVTATVAIVAASLRKGNRKITGSNNNSTGLSSQANKYVPPKSMAKRESDSLWVPDHGFSLSMSSASKGLRDYL